MNGRFAAWLEDVRRSCRSLREDFRKDPDGRDDRMAARRLDDEFLDHLTCTAPWIHHRRGAGNADFRNSQRRWIAGAEKNEADD